MNNKIVLPLDTKPIYQTYLYLYCPNSIISGNSSGAKEWIISNWLDLTFSDGSLGLCNRGVAFMDKGPLIYNNSHAIYHYGIKENPRETISKLSAYISNGYYIDLVLNEYEIPDCKAYHKRQSPHTHLIYGFDDMEKQFYALGYTRRNKLESFKISYNDLINAILACDQNYNEMNLIQFNESFDLKLDWNITTRRMKNFLNSQCEKSLFNSNTIYGLMAQQEYLNHLLDISRGNSSLDIRHCRLLMEYKSAVHELIKLHSEHKKIKDLSFYECYNSQHYMGLMYQLTKDKKLIDRMIEMLKKAFDKEQKILQVLFEN